MVTGPPRSNLSQPRYGTERGSRLTDIAVTQAPPANSFKEFVRQTRMRPAWSIPTEEAPKRHISGGKRSKLDFWNSNDNYKGTTAEMKGKIAA
jgi:hypothetical protein